MSLFFILFLTLLCLHSDIRACQPPVPCRTLLRHHRPTVQRRRHRQVYHAKAVHRFQAVLLAEGAHAGEVRRIRTPRLLVLRPGAPALRRQDGVRRGHPQGHQQSRARWLNVFAKGFAMEACAVDVDRWARHLCNVEREAVGIWTLRCAEC